ncbi:MAG: DNA recombination protein RmuC [Weeksellaceae bacterium]
MRHHSRALAETSKNLDKERELNKLLKGENEQLIQSNNDLSIELNTAEVHIEHLTQDNIQLHATIKDLNNKIVNTEYQYNDVNTKLSNQELENRILHNRLKEEKIEKEELNHRLKTEFENLANKILEEKSTRFTLQNKENLDQILKPFQQRIDELKKTVNETYDKESKQRFSLGEKVKELALLNQQISDDAKKLTRALKSESKTQGNWGEMILESILEKSGLVKGREYFMEYQLKDENNKALYSEFSGKKMRPDAIVKYPDHRNVIIDSKVSLKDFLDSVDETDEEIYQIKISQHLKSIKNHIQQLSQKAYDDYDKTLDFVMMFIPSESAYIAAMQADSNLWEYAYEKRVLLLNPSNLITSLKLLADLWKRDYQNKNAMQIAQKGAQLYDKFVGFVQNLEEVGKHINKAQNSYETAYKQLSTGRNNLVIQAHKLKELGIKNKKQMPEGLIDKSEPSYTEEE